MRQTRRMQFGICLASTPDDLDYVVEAEALGLSDLWAADSQMLWADVYAVLALAATRTTTMRLGTGVAVAPTRASTVTAAAIATINRLAPGRAFLGIGTGNTAMRVLGQPPMRIAAFERYLVELTGLLGGDLTEIETVGATSLTRHLMPDDGFVSFEPRVPVIVSAFGPRSLGVAARRGDGIITTVRDPSTVAQLRAHLAAEGEQHGRLLDRETFPMSSLCTMAVLHDGEAVDSARIRHEVGAYAIAGLHYAYEQFRNFGRDPGPHVREVWNDYVTELERTPEAERHLRIHAGHNCWVVPDEERFVTKELIDATCLVDTAPRLAERVRELDDAGLDQLVLLPPLEAKERVIRSVATEVMPLL